MLRDGGERTQRRDKQARDKQQLRSEAHKARRHAMEKGEGEWRKEWAEDKEERGGETGRRESGRREKGEGREGRRERKEEGEKGEKGEGRREKGEGRRERREKGEGRRREQTERYSSNQHAATSTAHKDRRQLGEEETEETSLAQAPHASTGRQPLVSLPLQKSA